MPKLKPKNQPSVKVDANAGVLAGVAGLPDRVWGSCGLTINLQNYQSARVDAGMATDVHVDETPEEAIARVYEFVTHEVSTQISEVRAALASGAEEELGGKKKKTRR